MIRLSAVLRVTTRAAALSTITMSGVTCPPTSLTTQRRSVARTGDQRFDDGLRVGRTAVPGIETKLTLCAAYGRPVLCTEWLVRRGGNDFKTLFPLFRARKIGCWNWGLVAGRTYILSCDPGKILWELDSGNPFFPSTPGNIVQEVGIGASGNTLLIGTTRDFDEV